MHATHPSVAPSLSASPSSTYNFRVRGSARIFCNHRMKFRLSTSKHRLSRNHCLRLLELPRRALQVLKLNRVPSTVEASSFHDAFAHNRKGASCPGMMLRITSLDHSRLKSKSWLLNQSQPQANSLSELKRWFQPSFPGPSLLCRVTVFSVAISR